MTTGEGIAVVAGVGVIGIGGYLLLRRQQAGGGPIFGAPPAPSAAAAVAARPASPTTTAAARLLSTVQNINTSGCTAIASKSGVPSALAQAGCSSYVKYLSPIGATQTIIHAAEKIPVVGKAISATENAVSKVVSAPISAVKSFLGSIF
jgi:hypothetical protein